MNYILIFNIGDYNLLKNISVLQGDGYIIGSAIYDQTQYSYNLNPSLLEIVDINDKKWFVQVVYKSLMSYICEELKKVI